MLGRRLVVTAVALVLAGCSGSSLSTAAEVATATRLANQACVGAPSVLDDGSATCAINTTGIAVWGTTSERDKELAKIKANTPGASFVTGGTWYIFCTPADASRIAAATGGKVQTQP
jgi:hypothetical protein